MDQELTDAAAYAPGRRFVCIHCAFLREKTPSRMCEISKISLRPSMCIYLKNNSAKSHSDPI